MALYLTAWLCGRSPGLFLSVLLTFYTFALLYVFRAPTFVTYKVLLAHNRTLNHLHGPNEIQHYSDHPSYERSSLKTVEITSFIDTQRDPLSDRYVSLSWNHRVVPLSISDSGNEDITKGILPMHQSFSVQHRKAHGSLRNNQFFYNTRNDFMLADNFRSRLRGQSVQILREIIGIFDQVLTSNDIDYMIYGGTLIGSYRHHSFVPWDDDIDVLVPYSKRHLLYKVLSHIGSGYILNSDSEYCWKLFSVFSEPIKGCSWKWPYLDIFFYAENETHIWDTSPRYTDNFAYPKTIVFPLRRRPFMNMLLLAPQNARAVLSTNYNISLCKSGNWIHKWERNAIETTVPCTVLYSKFPFVWRTVMYLGCNETLNVNGQIISYFFNSKAEC